jgi:hypothetical protein
MMAAIGREKGKPFQPTARQRELLDKAAKAAFKISKVEVWNGLVDQPEAKYYPDQQCAMQTVTFWRVEAAINFICHAIFRLQTSGRSRCMTRSMPLDCRTVGPCLP